MKVNLKITRRLLAEGLDDLERPHPFAHERLGFFSLRRSTRNNHIVLLATDYHEIADDLYISDPHCGGRIGGEAIRQAMGRSIGGGVGQLWVHTHGRSGVPVASAVDCREGPRVAQSLANAHASSFHGWAVLSEDGMCGEVIVPGSSITPIQDFSVVGFPMLLPDRFPPSRKRRFLDLLRPFEAVDYDRQSFLGENSQAIFSKARIGVVGLGGGGSHVCQQLAHIGFLNLVLCDNDRTEKTNLNRLIGATMRDAIRRRYKTSIASRLIKALHSSAVLSDAPASWEEKREQLRECDMVFGCLDSFRARRDLEAFCRSQLIPLIDIGMMVLPDRHEISGQVALSLPGESCLHCLRVLTPENLAEEAQGYGAGNQPQVVWPNGTLASAAVGYAVQLLTGWSGKAPPARLDYRGSTATLSPSNLLPLLKTIPCSHYPLDASGDPVFRRL